MKHLQQILLRIINRNTVQTFRAFSSQPQLQNIRSDSDEAQALQKLNQVLMSSHVSDIDKTLDRCNVKISPSMVENILQNFSNAGILAFKFFRWAARQREFEFHTAAAYDLAVDALARAKQYDLMWSLVDEMRRKDLLHKETFYLIIRRYARARDAEMAVEAFEMMESYGIRRNLECFHMLIRALCKKRQMHMAQQVFEDLKNGGIFRPNLKTYSILLNGWAELPLLEKAESIFKEMQEVGLELDSVSYGIYFRALCKGDRLDDALNMFKEMQSRGYSHDSHIYSILIHGLGDKHRTDSAVSLFEEMKAVGFEPEIHTCNALVRALCSVGKFQEARDILDREHVSPNSRTCNLILYHLLRLHRREEAYVEFWRMVECGRDLDLNIYTMMVQAFIKDDRVDMAMKAWKRMISNGLCPSMFCYCTVINGFLDKGNWKEASRFFEEMIEKGMRPFSQTFDRLKNCLIKVHRQDILVQFLERRKELAGGKLLSDLGGAKKERRNKKL